MTMPSRLSYLWQNPVCTTPYETGVSLHSHTSLSRETLSLVHEACRVVPFLDRVVTAYDRRCRQECGFGLDFEAAHWSPPLVPRMAWDLEQAQIQRLGLRALVSITDHDDLGAPLLLRTVPSARHIPLSLEWSVPFGRTAFHLGVHNLPSAHAVSWMERLSHFTAHPSEAELQAILAELHALPQVLLVLNHPQWDLFGIGQELHAQELGRFLLRHNEQMHAFELNGLRHARENHSVVRLAQEWKQLVISGGDRHGLEPNANINLTNAASFQEFVHEIRVEKRSHILFMPQYRQPWRQRILNSTLDAISDHPHFSPGWQRWDERAFHPDATGQMRPLAELWTTGQPPLPLHAALHAARLFRSRTASHVLRFALRNVLRSGGSGLETLVGESV